MFKTQFKDTYSPFWAVQNEKRYHIVCVQNPVIRDGKRIFYQAEFTNKKDAFVSCVHFNQFFEDVFFLADVIYFRILSLPDYENNIKRYNRPYYDVLREVTENRSKIVLNLRIQAYAFEYIWDIYNFIDSVILLIPYYYRTNENIAEKCFSMLNYLKDNFRSCYHKYCFSLNPNDLRILCK